MDLLDFDGDAAGALERFEKVAEMDISDRLGMSELVSFARGKVAESTTAAVGGNPRLLGGNHDRGRF